MKPVRKAVFPVGGLGTRFLPATKSVPKEMLPVAAKPLIQYAFEEALEAGIEQFIFVTGRNKNAINNHFNHAFELQAVLSEQEKEEMLAQVKDWLPKSGQVMFIPQQDPAGLGHAVWCARHAVGNEPFAVLLADEMVLHKKGALLQMMDAYHNLGGNIIAVAEVPKKETSKYGILDPDGSVKGTVIKAKGMVEKPEPAKAPSNLSLTGRYILQPDIFDYLDKGRKHHKGGEIQLTNAMAKMLRYSPYYGYKFKGERFDCGSQVGFLEANIAYALESKNKHIVNDIKTMLKKYNGSK
jgi:UTP--glucose-1-phosphate uridylyltransferase